MYLYKYIRDVWGHTVWGHTVLAGDIRYKDINVHVLFLCRQCCFFCPGDLQQILDRLYDTTRNLHMEINLQNIII